MKHLFKNMMGLGFQCLTVGLILLCLFVLHLEKQLPNVSVLKDAHMQTPLRIYSKGGKLIAEYGAKRRKPVPLSAVPPLLIKAVIATEDQRFYEHPGVDIYGLLRAARLLIITGDKAQGGSTITMQVARNFFLTRKKTYTRKLKEILLALKIDKELSKNKVLELYLNKIYYGNGAYGIGAASRVYYGKPLKQLTLPQLAMLAGLPKAPSALNPLANPRKAIKRRNHVLERLLEENFISQNQFHQAKRAPITAKYHGIPFSLKAPYIAEMVRQVLYARYGKKIYTMGFNVYTTVSSKAQTAANQALKTAIDNYAKRHPNRPNPPEGALIAMKPQSGAILALVGGVNFKQSKFNRATQALRQAGSSFKPFIYAAALSKGFTLASVINDAPIVLPGYGDDKLWRPQNSNRQFAGPTRLRVGLIQSRNLVSIRLLKSIGLPYALNYLKHFGFAEKTLPHSLSLALGTGLITPLQLATGYCVFANGGYQVTPFFIAKITNNQHKIIYQAPQLAQQILPDLAKYNSYGAPRVISPQIAYLITSAMHSVITQGTGRAARVLKRQDLSGKTGTTNDQMDAWFSGFNGNIVATAWMGYDANTSLREYGSQAALPMWIDFMREELKSTPEAILPEPPGIISMRIDKTTGKPAPPTDKNALFELFRTRNAPSHIAVLDAQNTPTHSLPAYLF